MATLKQRSGGFCRFLQSFLSLFVFLAVLVGVSGCGGGGGGTGGGASAPSPVAASGATPATPEPSQTPNLTTAPTPAPAAPTYTPTYTPNYVPNLVATRRWDHKIVTVQVALPAANSAGETPDPSPLVQQAIDLWSHKVGQDVQFQIVSGSSETAPDVTVSWAAASSFPNEAIGRTQVQFRTEDQVLVSAQVSVVESLPDSFKVQVVAHELGHALGVDGHSADATDLMYANAHLPAVVTASDQNTILWSYEVGATRSATRPSYGGAGSGISTVETICGRLR